jgi:[ribosomal protein S5]-alanine N-acetyltransferase
MSMPSSEIKPLDLSRFSDTHPTLETERLRLRRRKMTDKDDIFEYASDAETTQYMIWPTHQSLADTIAFLENSPKGFANRESIGFAMELKSSGKMIGDCGFHNFSPKHHTVMIGYVLNRKYWGFGYMTEAVRELIRFAFEEMGMHRLSATCDLENERSARVMERCGMTHEGTFRDYEIRRGRFVTVKSYAIVKNST